VTAKPSVRRAVKASPTARKTSPSSERAVARRAPAVLVPVSGGGDAGADGSSAGASQPIYQQIAASLRAAIADGTYPVGAR